jgi:hypothetical protein
MDLGMKALGPIGSYMYVKSVFALGVNEDICISIQCTYRVSYTPLA